MAMKPPSAQRKTECCSALARSSSGAGERRKIRVDVPDKTGVPANCPMTERDAIATAQATKTGARPEADGPQIIGQTDASAAELNNEEVPRAIHNDESTIIDDVCAPYPIILQARASGLRRGRS